MGEVMDDLDLASIREQELRDAALEEQARRGAERELIPCMRCHWCNEGIPPGALFCRSDAGGSCAADWQRDHDARKRNGG